MEKKILVAYASTHGSTQEVAENIAETLREQALSVDLLPAKEVRSLQRYSAVVLGAPIYMFHLHKHALQFLSRHEKALCGGIPIAIFAGGPFASGNGNAEELQNAWLEVRRQLDQELAKFPWLRPVSVELIGGKFDPSGLRFPWNLIPAMRKLPPSDLRNWDAIQRWSSGLAGQLQYVLAN
jgi:menaquinone-dependent protoporphyrinogen oxidase